MTYQQHDQNRTFTVYRSNYRVDASCQVDEEARAMCRYRQQQARL